MVEARQILSRGKWPEAGLMDEMDVPVLACRRLWQAGETHPEGLCPVT